MQQQMYHRRGREFGALLSLILLTATTSLDFGILCSSVHKGRHHATPNIGLQLQDQSRSKKVEVIGISSTEKELLPQTQQLKADAEKEQSKLVFEDDPLIVQTKKGRVKGATLIATTGKKVFGWFGIPYAQKPLGERHIVLDSTTLSLDFCMTVA